MRADFKVGDLLIEYAGLMDDPKYLRRIQTKKLLVKESGIRLAIITPMDWDNLDSLLEGVTRG